MESVIVAGGFINVGSKICPKEVKIRESDGESGSTNPKSKHSVSPSSTEKLVAVTPA